MQIRRMIGDYILVIGYANMQEKLIQRSQLLIAKSAQFLQVSLPYNSGLPDFLEI